MAGAVKIITFAERQSGIPACVLVNLKFSAGDCRAEYLSGSETDNGDGTWSYSFLVQEEDLPGPLNLEDINTCNLVEPLWHCLADDEEAEEEEECRQRTISCFSGLELLETLGEDDYVAIFRYNEDCDTFCLKRMTPAEFKNEIDNLE